MNKKPQTEYYTLSDIIDCMDGVSMSVWWEVMGITIPNLSNAIAVAEVLAEEDCDDPYGTVDELEDEYVRQHGLDVYEVWWPEHCIHRKFNSDATYRLAESSVSS